MTAGRSPLCSIVLPGALFLVAAPGFAGGFDDEPMVLRLSLSLDRSSNYSDTAGRQASVAFPGASSDNPAGGDWQPRDPGRPAASLTGIHLFSESGARVTAAAGTVNTRLRDAGTVSVAYARTETGDGEIRGGLSVDLRSNEFFASYSYRYRPGVSLGATVRATDSVLEEAFFAPALGGLTLEAETESKMLDATFGLLAEPRRGWFVGATAGVGRAEADATVRNRVPLPVLPAGAVLPAGTRLDRFDDTLRSFGARVGIGYSAHAVYGVYLDAQYLTIESDRAGSADIARLQAGVDFRLSDALVLRSGIGVDSENEVTLSAGASFGSGPLVAIVAWQYNSQPELRREFGRFELVSASLSYRF